jgi:hypothetical protein
MIIQNGRGMTLIEIIVATAVTTTVLMAVTQVMLVSRQAINLTAIECDLAAQAVSVSDRIANELKDGVLNTITAPTGTTPSTTLTFQKCLGYGTSTMTLSNPITYAPYQDPIRNIWCVRRTENGASMELTDALKPNSANTIGIGLQFTRFDTTVNHDIYYVSVTLVRGTFSVTRATRVQLKF